MINKESPVPIYQLGMLQAYLYEIFSIEIKCEKNFKYTEWYLKEKFSQIEVVNIIQFFKDKGLSCDCDILKKIDLRKFADDTIEFIKDSG
ncbi:MAG: hypothetical protein ACUVT3_10850 [Ignavibacterium sp.]